MFTLIAGGCGFSVWECEFVEKVAAHYPHMDDRNKVKLIKEVYNFDTEFKEGHYVAEKVIIRTDGELYTTASDAMNAGRQSAEKEIMQLEKYQLTAAQHYYDEYKKLSCTAHTNTLMRDLYQYCDGQSI